MKRSCHPPLRRALACAAALLGLAARAAAHDGPPYPILVDERVAGVTLSVWADPDVGEGTFYYYVEGAEGGVSIAVEAQALDATGLVARGASAPAPPRAPYQLVGSVPFAHRGTWRARFRVTSPAGAGALEYDLAVTPPGLGAVELTWYAVPFAAAAALWLRIFLARRSHARNPLTTPVEHVA